jgi:hypothetical protein
VLTEPQSVRKQISVNNLRTVKIPLFLDVTPHYVVQGHQPAASVFKAKSLTLTCHSVGYTVKTLTLVTSIQ